MMHAQRQLQKSFEIEPSDVIRLLEQYLKENNLSRTLQCLQEETSVSLNTVDSVEGFVHDINSGHWDVVLKAVKLMKLPDDKQIDLYEQIAIELIELRETRAANWIIHKTEPMKKLKSNHQDRYLHLQNLLGRSFFDHREAYRDSSREERRSAIAEALKREVSVVPPQRLLTLLGDALKWQKHEGLLPSGSSMDIFTGKAKMIQVEEETHPNTLHKHCIRPIQNVSGIEGGQIIVSCSEFSPGGHYLMVGYSTGLVELRNSTTGRLAHDLSYQAQKNYIVTPRKTAVLCFCFRSSEVMAIGDKSGDISVWRIDTGQIVQIFNSVHSKGVRCLIFHPNGKDLLSGGNDKTVQLHSLRSNKTIHTYEGHRAFVTTVAFSKDGNQAISGSSDCTVKIWNRSTGHLLRTYENPSKVHTVTLMPNFKCDIFLVADRSRSMVLIDLDAKVRTKLSDDLEQQQIEQEEGGKVDSKNVIQMATSAFNAASPSPKGNWIYAVDSDSIHCFNYSTKKLVKKIQCHEDKDNDLIGIGHHPLLNLMVTYDTQGNLNLWKP